MAVHIIALALDSLINSTNLIRLHLLKHRLPAELGSILGH
jgi:hypothetical protein